MSSSKSNGVAGKGKANFGRDLISIQLEVSAAGKCMIPVIFVVVVPVGKTAISKSLKIA